MENLFYKLGKRVGKSLYRGRYLYKTLTGSSDESLEAEYALGLILARDIEKETQITEQPEKQLLVEAVLRRLQKRVKNKKRYFTVKVLKTHNLNAFALPGGFIYITEHLSDQLSNDRDALAFVLAHEMVHIILKHPLKRIMASYSIEALSRMFKTGSALGVAGKSLVIKLLRSQYSQENELQADAYGLRLMYSAGFDPQGALRLIRFFRLHLQDEGFKYFATHPSLNKRLAHLHTLYEEIKGK